MTGRRYTNIRKYTGIGIALIGVLTLHQLVRADQGTSVAVSRETAVTRAIAKASHAVAGINVIKLQKGPRGYSSLFNDPRWSSMFPESYRRVESLGSGLIISSDGYVVTNAHVVENAAEIIVTIPGGEQYEVEAVFTDALTDIGLLKIKGHGLPTVTLGDSDDLILGEWVIALGNPLGLFDVSMQPTATLGIISGLHMNFGHKEQRVYQDMIQTDAAINPGNSGGPLVNAHGEVVGVNSFIFTENQYSSGSIGIGFAIPINRVKDVVADLRTKGRVDREIATGLRGQPVDRMIQQYLNLPYRRGFLIKSVEPDGAGDRAGLEPGDILLEANGRQVNSRRDFITILQEDLLKAGDSLNLKVWRNGNISDYKMVLSH